MTRVLKALSDLERIERARGSISKEAIVREALATSKAFGILAQLAYDPRIRFHIKKGI